MAKNKGIIMLEAETVLSIFDFEVYRYSKDTGYFWKNTRNPQGSGPFNTLEAVMLDYAAKTRAEREVLMTDSNVIRVDFRAKKRMR